MTRPVQRLGGLILASCMGCGGADDAANAPPAQSPAPAVKTPATEASVREMKPADKPDEPRPAAKATDVKPPDEPPELVAPAGAKDERPDAANPK